MTITRKHLALHQGSTFPACDARLLVPLQAITMTPGDVDCGNCVRTTLYRVVVRVTEQVAALPAALEVNEAGCPTGNYAIPEAVHRGH